MLLKTELFQIFVKRNHCIALYFHVFDLHRGLMPRNQFYCLFFQMTPSSQLKEAIGNALLSNISPCATLQCCSAA